MSSKNQFLLLLLFMPVFLWSKDIVSIPEPSVAKSEKEALLILVGFGSKTHNVKHIAAYFSNKGYDLYQPDYIRRKGIAKGVEKLDAFITEHDLKAYGKVHVFCYLVGGWTFNSWLSANELPNLSTIIYDRSPLQERAPFALMEDMPFLITLAVGKIMGEFAETPYKAINLRAVKIGLLIEDRPTKLIMKHRKSAAKLGPVDWDPQSLQQEADDYCFVPLNHDDFYEAFGIIGPSIFEFIRDGKFAATANRKQPLTDPFIP